jgi:hypothetical protein
MSAYLFIFLYSCDSGYILAMGYSEYGNKLSGSIKCAEFLTNTAIIIFSIKSSLRRNSFYFSETFLNNRNFFAPGLCQSPGIVKEHNVSETWSVSFLRKIVESYLSAFLLSWFPYHLSYCNIHLLTRDRGERTLCETLCPFEVLHNGEDQEPPTECTSPHQCPLQFSYNDIFMHHVVCYKYSTTGSLRNAKVYAFMRRILTKYSQFYEGLVFSGGTR